MTTATWGSAHEETSFTPRDRRARVVSRRALYPQLRETRSLPSRSASAALRTDPPGPRRLPIPSPVLGEVGYMVHRQIGSSGEARFLRSLDNGAFALASLTFADVHRMAELIETHADLHPGHCGRLGHRTCRTFLGHHDRNSRPAAFHHRAAGHVTSLRFGCFQAESVDQPVERADPDEVPPLPRRAPGFREHRLIGSQPAASGEPSRVTVARPRQASTAVNRRFPQ